MHGKPRISAFAVAACVVLSLSSACSRLPEYAAPKRGEISATDALAGDLIAYRQLTRADFKGTEPPEAFAAVADKVGAATCARIVGDPPAEVEIKSLTNPSGEGTHTARIRSIGYRALMDRGCSWWNDRASAQDPAYVLEHEQIHFAIFEVEARRLDITAKELARSFQLTEDSLEAARDGTTEEIQDLFEKTSERVMERNRDFDEDTSLGYEPARQKDWLRTIESELAATKR